MRYNPRNCKRRLQDASRGLCWSSDHHYGGADQGGLCRLRSNICEGSCSQLRHG